jgi:hypothetical protein
MTANDAIVKGRGVLLTFVSKPQRAGSQRMGIVLLLELSLLLCNKKERFWESLVRASLTPKPKLYKKFIPFFSSTVSECVAMYMMQMHYFLDRLFYVGVEVGPNCLYSRAAQKKTAC